MSKVIWSAHAPHDPDDAGARARAAVALLTGMKSTTSPTPASVMKRVTRIAVSGKYSCLRVVTSLSGRTR